VETLQGLAGLALIVGLFVFYARERRAKGRPPVVDGTPPVARVEALATPDAAPSRGSSPNWGAPIVFVLLLLGAATHRGSWWGVLWQVLYFVIIGVALYSTFSPKEFAAELARRPGTTRGDVYLTLGVPYILVPIAGWIVTIPFNFAPGAFIPALPWVALIVAGSFVGAREKLK
jgi:hypothetical protein